MSPQPRKRSPQPVKRSPQPVKSESTLSYQVDEGDIKLTGFIDRFTVPTLIKGIDISKISIEHLVIDFSAVEKVDTAGLAWILKVMSQARQSGQTVKLTAIPEQLVNLAEISGVEQLLVSV
ncbi:MAG: STAS domain-containing protein [Psychrosphaera sp.]|nr:STAS domain-containing protein [Psychrosphaera sp.]